MECPKCQGSGARYEKSTDGLDLSLVHVCGYRKVVATLRQEMVIEHFDLPEEVKLPREGSNLRKCLNILVALQVATSGEVAERMSLMEYEGLDCSVSNVSSMLTILRYKSLVEVMENSRWKKGGSTWALTKECKRLLGVK